jgi:hypothetical protein
MKTTAEIQRADGQSRDAAVVAWRREQLLAAGFPAIVAESLSRDCGVDLHAIVDLVERGCPPLLAVRILAPLGDESRQC